MTQEVKNERIAEAYKKNYAYWLIYAGNIFKDSEFAKEVVQQTVYECLIWGGGDKDVENYGAYITSAIKLVGYKLLKRHKRKLEIAHKSLVGEPEYDEYNPKDISLLDLALRKLKPSYAEVLKMKYIEDMDAGEIADKLGTTRDSVSSRMSRAYNVIREFIQTGIFTHREVTDGKPVSQETIKVYELRNSGMSNKDIAAMLGLTPVQVSDRYCNYLKRIKSC